MPRLLGVQTQIREEQPRQKDRSVAPNYGIDTRKWDRHANRARAAGKGCCRGWAAPRGRAGVFVYRHWPAPTDGPRLSWRRGASSRRDVRLMEGRKSRPQMRASLTEVAGREGGGDD